MSTKTRFGFLLRKARQQAGFKTMTDFADHLSALGLPYSDEAIGHWENNRRKPSREVLLQVLGALAAEGGITQLRQVNEMLWYLDQRNLDSIEQSDHFANLSSHSLWSNLPPRDFETLVGRDDALAHLTALLTDPSAKPVVVLSGLGGIGKTAIAHETVRQVMASGQFEQLAWENTRSEEFVGVAIRIRQAQHINTHSVLVSIAHQLGFEAIASASPQALPHRLREVVRSGNYLIVLDNLETLDAAREVAELLHTLVSPAGSASPSKVLITSRERLVDEPFVYDYFVRGLSEPASLELLRQEIESRGATEFAVGDDLAHRIFTVTGGMPLALKLIVSQYLLGITLNDELDRLEAATNEEELYRFLYFSLWEKLPVLAQQVLAGAAAFGTSAMRSMLMRVSQVMPEEFDDAIADLIRASLIEVIMPMEVGQQQRYDIHPMTSWFVNAPLTELWNRQKGDE